MQIKNDCSFIFPNEKLIVYGEKLSSCLLYFYYNSEIQSAEDICIYASTHDLSVIFVPSFSIKGLHEYLRILRLTLKYSVLGSYREFTKMV